MPRGKSSEERVIKRRFARTAHAPSPRRDSGGRSLIDWRLFTVSGVATYGATGPSVGREDQAMEASGQRRRNRLQFTLRTLMALTTMLCLVLGLLGSLRGYAVVVMLDTTLVVWAWGRLQKGRGLNTTCGVPASTSMIRAVGTGARLGAIVGALVGGVAVILICVAFSVTSSVGSFGRDVVNGAVITIAVVAQTAMIGAGCCVIAFAATVAKRKLGYGDTSQLQSQTSQTAADKPPADG